jgi:hypothetical protein
MYELPFREVRKDNVPTPIFCGAECLGTHLENRTLCPKVKTSAPVRPLMKRGSSDLVIQDTGDVWSTKLGTTFRSEFEMLVGEFLLSLEITAHYERITLNLGGAHYTPDFYLPKARVFIEVKGVWAFGGKTKFKKAVEDVPEQVILIPWWMKEAFRVI